MQRIPKNEGLHLNFARDPEYSWFHEHSKNESIAYIKIYYKYLKEIIYNLGGKTQL